MIIHCQSCGSTYGVADDKVRGRRVRVRCKSCGTGIVVDGREIAPEDMTRQLRPEDATHHYKPSFDEEEATKVITAPSPRYFTPQAPAAGAPKPQEWSVSLNENDQQTMTLAAIVEAYNSGFLPPEAYVWREGMSDWVPFMQVDEIRAALESGAATKVVDAATFARNVARSTHDPPTPVAYIAPTAPPRAYEPEATAAAVDLHSERTVARVTPQARSRRGADLFGGAAKAGSEDELLSNRTEPALARYDEKPTGARNESSVLFSLDALKSKTTASAPQALPPSAPSGPSPADILSVSNTGALFPVASDTAALLSAPVAETPAVAEPVPRSRMDTLPPARRGSSKWVLMGGSAAAAAAIVGGAWFFVSTRNGDAAPQPTPTPAVAAPASKPEAPPSKAKPAEPAMTAATVAPQPVSFPATPPAAPKAEPAEEAPPAPSPRAPASRPSQPAQAPASKEPAGLPPESPPSLQDALKASVGAGAGSVPKVELAEEDEAESPAGEGAAPAEPSGPPFDAAAAKAALGSAAANAAACKQPDGPTGKGKVQVTFAASGRATNAAIVGGAFGGTSVGGCIARAFRSARVPAFSGDAVTVSKSFSIPE